VAKIVIENVYKSFPHRQGRGTTGDTSQPAAAAKSTHATILRSINLTANEGEFLVLVGPSGCGKSTLLRLIAGLEELTGGNIWIGERLVNDLPPKARDIAMVFQNYALYPHLNVYDNIAFGLRRMISGEKGEKKSRPDWTEALFSAATRQLPSKLRYLSEKEKAVEQQVRRVAELLQIELLLDRLPKQLSGGQKQRVALGRAIARNPQAFLMDEPLSNLDAKLRAETRSQIVKLQRQLGTTTIYVTHDQTEAMTMGDRIAVMERGEIQQLAPPLEIYNAPANRFVAEFIGSPPMNFLPVMVRAPLFLAHDQFRCTLLEDWQQILQFYDGESLLLGIRPEHLSLSPPAPKNLQVQVDLVEALGNETYLTAHIVGDSQSSLQARISPEYSVRVGESVWLSMAMEKVHLFDPRTGRNIRQ
jgi:multiple sugar transport system ATP-binding protein